MPLQFLFEGRGLFIAKQRKKATKADLMSIRERQKQIKRRRYQKKRQREFHKIYKSELCHAFQVEGLVRPAAVVDMLSKISTYSSVHFFCSIFNNQSASQVCQYGDFCRFAHGEEDLTQNLDPKKAKERSLKARKDYIEYKNSTIVPPMKRMKRDVDIKSIP